MILSVVAGMIAVALLSATLSGRDAVLLLDHPSIHFPYPFTIQNVKACLVIEQSSFTQNEAGVIAQEGSGIIPAPSKKTESPGEERTSRQG